MTSSVNPYNFIVIIHRRNWTLTDYNTNQNEWRLLLNTPRGGLLPRAGARRPGPRCVDRQDPSGLQKAVAALGQAAAQRQSPGIDQRNAPTRHRQTAGSGRGANLGLLCSQREPEAVGNLPSSGLLHRFGCGRSRLQDRHWRSLQTIGHVLVGVRSRKHPRSALHSQPPSPRGLLEI